MAILPLLSLATSLLLMSIVFTMLGQGGGAVYTPLQVLFGFDFYTAASNSLFLIMVSSVSATVVFRKANKIDWKLALTLEIAAATGAFLGGLFCTYFEPKTLASLFALVVLFAGIMMGKDGLLSGFRRSSQGSRFSWKRKLGEQEFSVNLPVAFPCLFVAGVISGLIGIGGGIIKVPIMVLVLGIPMGIAIGCSALMVGITASAGFVGHVISGHWDWQMSLILAVVVFIGGRVGARISVGFDQLRLRRLCAYFMVGTAFFMAAEAWFFTELLTEGNSVTTNNKANIVAAAIEYVDKQY